MTREELKAHCEKQIEACEMWAISKGEKPSGKIYEEHKLILELLEQEPNTWSLDDAREDFMHDVYNTLDFLPTNEEANQIIDSFDRVTSSIEQEPRWIPISERLPEKFGTYLVTVKEGYMALGVWIGELEYWANVLAWMPLPQPYKAESEN